MKETFSAWLDAHSAEFLAETQAILRIPSVKESPLPGAPFGQPCADALAHTLALCERLGFRTESFDGYAGHAELGPEGTPEYVAALGHLDVVPPGDLARWSVSPWSATVDGDWLIGRGTSDDKGPTMAALYGAVAVMKSGVPLTHRIRLIFGCDEESGWECMEHYFGTLAQPKPRYAFAPDAEFPLIHAEKGAFTSVIEKEIVSRVKTLSSGLRPNMVPESATATLLDGTSLSETGVSAHGSTPEKGVSAALKLLATLDEPWAGEVVEFGKLDGAGLNLAGSDGASGALTCNLGVVTVENGVARATINVRYPVTWKPESVEATFREAVWAKGWQVSTYSNMDPLYVPVDAEPVKTLLSVYREHTGDDSPPLAIGGRTYATAVSPIGVAFGPMREGDPQLAHEPDEKIAISRLLEAAKIYADALYRLAK